MPASSNNLQDRKKWIWGIAGSITLVMSWYVVVRWWSYPPAVEFDNLKYIQLLRTAVSAERSDWLAKVDEAITARVTAGEMSARERSQFERIIQLAHRGEWKKAHEECFEFEEAQLYRRREKPASDGHSHDHPH